MERTLIERVNTRAVRQYMVGSGMFINERHQGSQTSKEQLAVIVDKANRRGEEVYFIQFNDRKGIVSKSLF